MFRTWKSVNAEIVETLIQWQEEGSDGVYVVATQIQETGSTYTSEMIKMAVKG
jgi:hypothetical protein